MMYKECIDACFDMAKEGQRCCYNKCCCESKEPKEKHHCMLCSSMVCSEVCIMTARLCAAGMADKDMFEYCAKVAEKCAKHCGESESEHAKDCKMACMKVVEKCKACSKECKS